MHGKVALEVEFQEVGSDQYTKMFIETLRDWFHRELSEEQLSLLAQSIEESRLSDQSPIDLAANLVANWVAIFG